MTDMCIWSILQGLFQKVLDFQLQPILIGPVKWINEYFDKKKR